MRKNNKGFTLIELLAIIVILAIIAVITVPIILNIIDNLRKGAATDSAYGYKDAVNKAYAQELAKPNQEGLKLNGIYEVQSDGTLKPATGSTFGIATENYALPVSVSGDKPTSGTLTYENNVLTSGTLIIGDYTATYSNGSFTATKTGSVSNGQSGNQAPVAEHWDKYHQYIRNLDGYGEYDSIDSSWILWIQENTTNNIFEGCAKAGNSTFCLNPGLWDCTYDYETDNPVCTANGYVLGKELELEQGGFECELDEDLECYYPNYSNTTTILG